MPRKVDTDSPRICAVCAELEVPIADQERRTEDCLRPELTLATLSPCPERANDLQLARQARSPRWPGLPHGLDRLTETPKTPGHRGGKLDWQLPLTPRGRVPAQPTRGAEGASLPASSQATGPCGTGSFGASAGLDVTEGEHRSGSTAPARLTGSPS
jgi:hypothetical protein